MITVTRLQPEKLEELQAAWSAAVKAAHQATALSMRYNALLAETMAEGLVPPGWQYDVLREGMLRQESECAVLMESCG